MSNLWLINLIISLDLVAVSQAMGYYLVEWMSTALPQFHRLHIRRYEVSCMVILDAIGPLSDIFLIL